jgi:hypothetical protein
VAATRVRAVFFDCTPYTAGFFDARARALVPELELRVARPAAPDVIEALRGATVAMQP